MNKNLETFGHQRYKECKNNMMKRMYKMYAGVASMLAITLLPVALLTGGTLGWKMYAGFLTLIVVEFAILPLFLAKTPFKETIVDDLKISAFTERSVGLGPDSVIMHLIINEKEYVNTVAIKFYDTKNLPILESIEYFIDKKRDTKKRLNCAILSKTVSDKKIKVVFDKYTHKLTLVINTKVY